MNFERAEINRVRQYLQLSRSEEDQGGEFRPGIRQTISARAGYSLEDLPHGCGSVAVDLYQDGQSGTFIRRDDPRGYA
jgi:hypothetical protein